MSIYICYFLAISSIGYFIIKVPRILPHLQIVEFDESLPKGVGALVGLLIISIVVFSGLEPKSGYTTKNAQFPLIFLFTSTSLLLISLIEISYKISAHFTNKYQEIKAKVEEELQDLIAESDDISDRVSKANEMSLKLIAKEKSISKLSSSVFSREHSLKYQENKVKQIEERLDMKEKRLDEQEAQIQQVVSETIQQEKDKLYESMALEKELFQNELAEQYQQDKENLEKEREQIQKSYNEKMMEFVDRMTEKMEKRIYHEKESILDNVFAFDQNETDDFFELKAARESIQKEKEELEKSKFLLDVEEKVSQAKEHVLSAKSSALEVKSENVDLKTEMKLMMNQLNLQEEKRKTDYKIISEKLIVMDAQTKLAVKELSMGLQQNVNELKIKAAQEFLEINKSMSGMKLEFAMELNRLEGQEGKILNELENYYLKNQQFIQKCEHIALEAKRQNLNGQQILNQVNKVHDEHKLESKQMEHSLRRTMEQVALKEGQLANQVGESMLKLKNISDEQFHVMKDMALEKKDINLLWREKNIEHDMNLQEIKHQKNDLSRTRQLLSQEKSAFNQEKRNVLENAKLTHQSYMTEQQHFIALQKAQSSGGWLSQMAKSIEAYQAS